MRAKELNLKNFVRIAIVFTLVVIVLGAYTRLTDAGLGCPDWPGCYGQLTVPSAQSDIEKANLLYPELTVDAPKAWAEMIHRYFAGTLGLLVFAITFFSLKSKNVGVILPVSLSVLIVVQALLGMWTVTLKLMPVIVLAHLFGGFTLLCLLVMLHSRLEEKQVFPEVKNSIRYLAVAALIVLIAQIFLGGWTSSNYAALMCTTLPICQGDWVSHLDFKQAFTLYQPGHETYEFGVLEYGGRMTIHVAHRFGAILTVCVLALLCWKLYQITPLKKISLLIATLLTIQFSLGISNIVFHLPLVVAVLHNLGGALLLASIVKANYLLFASQTITHRVSGQEVSLFNRNTGGSHE